MTKFPKRVLFLLIGATAIASIGDDARPISDGMKVTLAYTVSALEKDLAMTTEGQAPSYIQGSGSNPTLEAALYGLKPGDSKRVVLSPEDGFGQYDDTKKITLPKTSLPPEVEPGMILHDPTGKPVTVADITDDSVVLDLNHPLAGQSLVMEVHILDVETDSGLN
jgi:FKBP-type peptidyl-prolyl cis-trans isomerase 2